jgi:hypothetical protein
MLRIDTKNEFGDSGLPVFYIVHGFRVLSMFFRVKGRGAPKYIHLFALLMHYTYTSRGRKIFQKIFR